MKIPWLSYTLVGAFGAAAALVAVLGATALTPPASLTPAGEATSAAITVMEYRDERTVAAEIEAAQPVEATLGLPGIVTSTACAPGARLSSGSVIASLNGQPILGLHSAVPFYRDIGPGASGSDVDALRAQLKTMGFDIGDKGPYTADLGAAIVRMHKDMGLRNRDGVFLRDETLWLPADKVQVKSCNAMLGSQYAPGTPFITFVGTLSKLRVIFPPEQPPTKGARLVSFGNVSAPVSADGTVTDPAFLAEVSQSPDFAASQSSNSPKPMSIKTSLISPLQVAKVPVSAVFGIKHESACVKTISGMIVPIVIAGSSVGSVLATFQQEVPGEVQLGSAIGIKECP